MKIMVLWNARPCSLASDGLAASNFCQTTQLQIPEYGGVHFILLMTTNREISAESQQVSGRHISFTTQWYYE
jgi:hypothetical protein